MFLTYLGQCAFLIEAGGARLVTDPYLSDALDRIPRATLEWKRAYSAPCTLAELAPDMVIISHSHMDHMDSVTLSAYRETGGDCRIAAPAPECSPLYKLGFSNVIPARAEQSFAINDMKITPIMCAHTQPHTDDMGRFRELSYIIDAEGKRLLFGGDLSLYDGLYERLLRDKPDYVILPANGRDEHRTSLNIIGNTDAREAAELAVRLDATLIPAHHDLYPSNGCPVSEVRAAAEKAGARIIITEPGHRLELN